MAKESGDIASLFATALELDAEGRAELERSCDEDTARELRELLSLHEEASGFLSRVPFHPSMAQASMAGLREAASGASQEPSVFRSLGRRSGLELTRVALPEESDDRDSSDDNGIGTASISRRYEIESEIARGGMGVILRGRDADLGRPIAIKRLLDVHRDNSSMVQRFVEEAQIGGQLQHPGIAPIYGLGHSEELPFFTMKLVKGQTLAALLAERQSVAADSGRFVGIFEQVCQAIAYAHSRGVIHRDLKPANIMVGAFGEVQVMDWGLAKVLKAGGVIDEKKARQTHHDKSIIKTIRSIDAPGSAGSDTQMGSVMGTPAYMPPEQALGAVDRLDERCDVFGLGAILCEILTGKPPYVAEKSIDVFRQSSRGKLQNCFQRLDSVNANNELVGLVKDCLELEPINRPRDASIVGERISSHLASVETRLREAEVQRVAEAARVVEERKRGKTTLAFAASILLLLVVGMGGWWWIRDVKTQRRLEVTNHFNTALTEARLQRDRADRSRVPNDRVPLLENALAAARQAVDIGQNSNVERILRDSAATLVSQLENEAEAARMKARIAAQNDAWKQELELIRVGHDDVKHLQELGVEIDIETGETTRQYRRVFAEFGLDLKTMEPDEIADVVRASPIAESLIAAMDHWVTTLSESSDEGDRAANKRIEPLLLASLENCDPYPYRRTLRIAIADGDYGRVRELVLNDDLSIQPPFILAWQGAAARKVKELKLSNSILQAAQRRVPGDFWLNFELSQTLSAAKKFDEALGFARAALAIRPHSSVANWMVVSILEQKVESALASNLLKERFGDSEIPTQSTHWVARRLKFAEQGDLRPAQGGGQ